MSLIGNMRGLQHLGIPVRDVAMSKRWYSETLGFQVIHEAEIPGDGGSIHVAFLEMNGLVLELYQLAGAELEEIKGRGQGHIDHIALDVDDIEAVFDQLTKAGIPTLEGAPRFLPFWERGVRFVTILGPDNEKIEFNQRL